MQVTVDVPGEITKDQVIVALRARIKELEAAVVRLEQRLARKKDANSTIEADAKRYNDLRHRLGDLAADFDCVDV